MSARQNSVSDTEFYLLDFIADEDRKKNSVSDTEFRVAG